MTENAPKKPSIDYVRFAELMAEKGWGPPELSLYAKIKYDTAYAIVSGRRSNPNSRTLKAIAAALGCTTDYLLGKIDTRYPPIEKLPIQIRQLSEVASRLSEIRQEELVKIAESLEELEREKPVYSVPAEAMNALLEVYEQIRRTGDHPDIMPLLEALLRQPPPRLLDLPAGESVDNTPDDE